MDSARKQLADAIRELLTDNYTVYHYPKQLESIGALTDAVIVVERRTLTPIRLDTFSQVFWIWIVVERTDEELAEDTLDAALEEVQGALDSVNWCTAPTATREMYDESRHAWRLEITTQGKRE